MADRRLDRRRSWTKGGDTLSKIARRYAVSIDSIKTWNNLKSSRINVGDRLTIYPRGSQD